MNRKIKFRAWDATSMQFVTDFVIDHLGNEYLWNRNETWGDDRAIVLTQYTGLNDRNGKEIYEGDIIRYASCDYKDVVHDDTGLVGMGHWYNGVMEDNFTYVGPNVKGISGLTSSWYNHLTGQLSDRCEVIGNVFENPELIKK